VFFQKLHTFTQVYAEFTSLRKLSQFAQKLNVYAVFTHCLRIVYAVFTQCLRSVYAEFTQCLRSVYAVFTQCLREYLHVCAVFAQ
jgi:hypothetical protein